jgi:SnoaL-like polyketide cyclase
MAFREIHPDVRFSIDDQLTKNNRAATQMIAKATRSSDGQTVTLYALNISRISDGRIIEEWMTWGIQPNTP